MKKCSVIVPLYRGKQYIDECIKSVIAQTYSNWELILMDDGSPDDTYDFVKNIVDQYTGYDIRLLRQENRGVAETRNTCARLAEGEYIAFMDQDDKMQEDYLERLMRVAENDDRDIVLCGFERRTDENKLTKRVTLQNDTWSKYRIITPWARVYKKSFLVDNDLKFLTTACCEDFYMTILAYAATINIGVVEEYAGYIWRYNPTSVSNTKQKSVTIVDAVCSTYEKIMQDLPENRVSLYVNEEYCFVRSCVYYLLYANHAENSKQIDYAYDKYFEFLEKYFPNYRKNDYISLFRPKSEEFSVRCMVWGFMLLKRIGLAKMVTKVWCKLAK